MKCRKSDTCKQINFLAVDTKMVGDLRSVGDIRVDGHVVGDIICTGQVVIGEMAIIIGNIRADTLIVYGEIVGGYHVVNFFKVASTGRFHANIRTGLVEIESGALFEGKICRSIHEIPAYDTEELIQISAN